MFASIKAYGSLILCALWAATVAWAFWYGQGIGEGRAVSQQARENALVQSAVDAANQVAAEAIARIEIKNVTVRQEVQREIIEKPVYRECRHDAGVMRSINSAISGADSAGRGKLPGSTTTD